eukprot:1138689-Pyramimonas_sp.AAC.1
MTGCAQPFSTKLAKGVHDTTIVIQNLLGRVSSRDDPSESRGCCEPFLSPKLLKDLDDGLEHRPS